MIDIYLQCRAVRASKAYGLVFFDLEIHTANKVILHRRSVHVVLYPLVVAVSSVVYDRGFYPIFCQLARIVPFYAICPGTSEST